MFGPASEGKRELTDGHEEIELALVELYRETGEKRYLELAGFLIEVRGHGVLGADEGNHTFNSTYYQDHLPVREMHRVVGHAVRMMYLHDGRDRSVSVNLATTSLLGRPSSACGPT